MKYVLLVFAIVLFSIGFLVDAPLIDKLRGADTVTPEHLFVIYRSLHTKIAAYACLTAAYIMRHSKQQSAANVMPDCRDCILAGGGTGKWS